MSRQQSYERFRRKLMVNQKVVEVYDKPVSVEEATGVGPGYYEVANPDGSRSVEKWQVEEFDIGREPVFSCPDGDHWVSHAPKDLAEFLLALGPKFWSRAKRGIWWLNEKKLLRTEVFDYPKTGCVCSMLDVVKQWEFEWMQMMRFANEDGSVEIEFWLYKERRHGENYSDVGDFMSLADKEEIEQRGEPDGEEGFNKYARWEAEKLEVEDWRDELERRESASRDGWAASKRRHRERKKEKDAKRDG